MNIYTGAMGMISFQGKMDVIGENIANASSTGYKADRESFKVFEESAMRRLSSEGKKKIGTHMDEVHIGGVTTNFDRGLIKVSEHPLDLTLSDTDGQRSFFIVEENGNQYLTKNSHYVLDHERTLSMQNGAYLLDEKGERITIPDGRPFSVSEGGTVTLTDTNETVGTIQMASVDERDLGFLKKAHSTLFSVMTPDELVRSFGTFAEVSQEFGRNSTLQHRFKDAGRLQEVYQNSGVDIIKPFEGKLTPYTTEMSNVDMTYEMSEMLIAQKGFSASQKVSTTFDRINEKAANELGR